MVSTQQSVSLYNKRDNKLNFTFNFNFSGYVKSWQNNMRIGDDSALFKNITERSDNYRSVGSAGGGGEVFRDKGKLTSME